MAHKGLQAVRGMNDLFPEDTSAWQALEATLREQLHRYGFGEIRLPLLEHSELFARAIGDVTDIVQKEMYTFLDRNGDSLTLRPEGTAGVVRALIEHGRLRGAQPRLYYLGPMFRHERPQKGRYRQFHQLGVEMFGLADASSDAELIALSAGLLDRIGVQAQLQINSLGTPQARSRYRELLLQYLRPREADLCADCRDRIERNPLRVLDCKVEGCRAVAAEAPRLLEYLDPESAEHFHQLRSYLDALEIPYRVNTSLVRGLDYYHRTVFEWVSDALGAQGTVLAGGRYDGLVEQLGGPTTPALGFAAGLERLLALQALTGHKLPAARVQLFLGALDSEAMAAVLRRAEALRAVGVAVVVGGPASLKALLKQAERSAARLQAIVGVAQLADGGQPVRLREQDAVGGWEGPWSELEQGLRSLGVDFGAPPPHTERILSIPEV
ncbi:MAG: histidine--tRNA ligase [Acidithiobacillus sp.]|uniref:histidine--tRNA ligase n=1 Tax=Acidithiobacillus sp. TaxID=1872118 RepID=UPI003D091A9B